jgi:hypothetical protein
MFSRDYHASNYNKLMNDIPVASQFNTFKANIGITIFDSCQGTFNKYFKMSHSNAKEIGTKSVLMSYLVYKGVLKTYIIKSSDYGYDKFTSMIDVYFTQSIFDKFLVKSGDSSVYMIFSKLLSFTPYVVKNNQLFYWKQSGLTGVLGDPCDFVNFPKFFNKDNRINEHNLIQGILILVR